MESRNSTAFWLAIAIVLALVLAGRADAQEVSVDVLDASEVRIEVEHVETCRYHQTLWMRVHPRQGETGVEVELWPFEIDLDYVEVDVDGTFTNDWTITGNGDDSSPTRLVVSAQANDEIFLHVEIAPVEGPARLLVKANGQTLESWANVPDDRPDEHPRLTGMRYVDTAEMGVDVMVYNPHAVQGQEAIFTAFGYPYGETDRATLTLTLDGWELVEYDCGMYATCRVDGERLVVDRAGGTGDEAWVGFRATLRARSSLARRAVVEFSVGDGERGVDNHVVVRDSAHVAFLPMAFR